MPRKKKEAENAEESKGKVEEVQAEKVEAKQEEASKEDKKAKLAKLLEKAKSLGEAVEESSTEALKEKVSKKKKKESAEEELVEKKDALVPLEDYLKSSIHLGTRVITPDMRKYVYRRRADGLAVFNTAILDDHIRAGAKFLAQFAPEEIVLVCKREAGWHAVETLSKATGIVVFTKKYPAGMLTNAQLGHFREAKLVVIADPWLDRNALADAKRMNVPVLSISDTNNYTGKIACVIPGNNKSAKSLGIIFYLMTKLYLEERGSKEKAPGIQEFVEGWDTLQPPK